VEGSIVKISEAKALKNGEKVQFPTGNVYIVRGHGEAGILLELRPTRGIVTKPYKFMAGAEKCT
jgi:hypothetical protein